MTGTGQPDLEREARIFGRYLIGEEIKEEAIRLYLDAHQGNRFNLSEKEARLLRLIHRHPALTGMIDGGLALQNKESAIRRKIFFLLAILETFPEYSRHYLFPEPASIKNIVSFFTSGVRGVLRMILGYLLVKAA